MGKLYDGIDDRMRTFIQDQPMFFVATAPGGCEGLVNLSPKGYRDSFAVLDEHTVAYLDLFGSGAETIAHLKDNGRITVMFCSFQRRSRILRLQGKGRVVRPDAEEFTTLAPHFNIAHPGLRSVIVVDVHRIADSCGFTVPYMELIGERPVLDKVQATRTPEDWVPRRARNTTSLDGLPALDPDHPLPTSVPR
jgi:hypothetical protein